MAEVADSGPVEPQARHIVYCGVCTLPPEYCGFGGTAKKCEEWLKDEEPELWNQLHSEDALNANLSALSVSAQERAAKDAAKKEAKAAQNEARDVERKAASKVIIKRVERNKRKYVTVISGLEVFGLENKKLAKELGKKFATGSSMTRSPSGTEEITVQGDVSEDVEDWLLEVYGSKVPGANIELVEDKKKKKDPAAV
ncbi:Translation machinery-associated protein 22 [Penicillium tannophilum]|uniref:Translation machinery-associated protein 22 n=1 Tax=Penicillium pulvis TaxID=1562058 RepID=UPI002549B1E2|nr:Translation machinery-associated protein 22 [Penicillium pulvis]KAJ5563835.1 Translation machinery-associated protein 22 [Penicillium glabrum]KAJ5809109.1 Translation machinery-associated protein 22 [Penicillium pulvis]KAJ5901361.1 Translation machinery-associated protein 22 [Penicillium tannophilum]